MLINELWRNWQTHVVTLGQSWAVSYGCAKLTDCVFQVDGWKYQYNSNINQQIYRGTEFSLYLRGCIDFVLYTLLAEINL